MFRLASFHRLVTAGCLALWVVFSVTFMLTLQPLDGPGDTALAVISAYAFLGAQAALVIGTIGVAHLLRDRTPVLAPIAAGLTALGGFGHAAFAGISLVQAAGGEGAAAAVQTVIAGPAGALAMVSVAGMILGVVVLAIALFRAKLGAGWIGVVLLGWIVVEFALSSLGLWAMLASAFLLFVGYGALAGMVFRSDLRDWMTAREGELSARPADERQLAGA